MFIPILKVLSRICSVDENKTKCCRNCCSSCRWYLCCGGTCTACNDSDCRECCSRCSRKLTLLDRRNAHTVRHLLRTLAPELLYRLATQHECLELMLVDYAAALKRQLVHYLLLNFIGNIGSYNLIDIYLLIRILLGRSDRGVYYRLMCHRVDILKKKRIMLIMIRESITDNVLVEEFFQFSCISAFELLQESEPAEQ